MASRKICKKREKKTPKAEWIGEKVRTGYDKLCIFYSNSSMQGADKEARPLGNDAEKI